MVRILEGICTNVIGVLPLESGLQVVVVIDQIQEPLEQVLALLLCDTVDVRDVSANGEDALPSRDGVGSHDWVDGLEVAADILRGATRLFIELEALAIGNVAEAGLLKGCRQSLEELLVGLADFVVDFISGCPERVCELRSALHLACT
jgi:hypothetical protein